jgi:hypothetical protein
MMLAGQAWAFDVGGFSYATTSRTTVQVTGRASGNTDTDIVIPATASDGSITYKVTTIGEDQRKHWHKNSRLVGQWHEKDLALSSTHRLVAIGMIVPVRSQGRNEKVTTLHRKKNSGNGTVKHDRRCRAGLPIEKFI